MIKVTLITKLKQLQLIKQITNEIEKINIIKIYINDLLVILFL